MDFQIYLMQLENLLKERIRVEDYIDTGALLESIQFKLEETSTGISIELGANDYIQYLDNGKFIEEFFNSSQFESLMNEAVTAYVNSKIK